MKTEFSRIIAITASLTVLGASGCESFESVLAGVGAGSIAKASGADTDLSIAIGAGVGIATAIVLDVVEKRNASESEHAQAEAKAEEQLGGLEEDERSDLKENNTYVVVPVNEDATGDTKEVMIVDPETGKPVDDTVYVVDTSKSDVESGEKVELGGYDAVYVD